ncbi:DUF6338 family protein [Saccharothrix syringae]|uniref:Uncharacterized protein n=1 Tax=Saccharothrix syringae TaxID=103733 RepID=A0A5Q0GSD9_SACSY|nr:DUF6338 family protein [Saccharothrix syringae]QFZ16888.1 hypothetical protein EKG83_04860 [Saccharothrix syringae]
MPQTLGALLSFLALVAPGIVFELLRERRRAGYQETPFREASRVALGSLVFTLLSCGLLVAANALLRADVLVDLDRLVAGGAAYARANLFPITFSVVSELALACALATLTDLLLARRRREVNSVDQQTAWRQVFRRDRPPNTLPWVHVQLTDGTSFFGFLRSHTTSGVQEERELVLQGTGMVYAGKAPNGSDEHVEDVIGERWARVVIPATQIRYLRVQYRDRATGALVDTRTR